MAGLVPAVMESTTTASHHVNESKDSMHGDQRPAASPFDTTPRNQQYPQAQGPRSLVDIIVQQSPTLTAHAEQIRTSVTSDGEERIILPPIERWEELSCIRLLDRFHDQGGIDERGYQILYRMCQIIWGIGHEVAIRKKVKLPRAQRLAKFQQYFDCLLQGAKVWQKTMKAQIRRVWDVAGTLPYPYFYDAFQDVAPLLERIYEALRSLYYRSLEAFRLFARIFEHYQRNYNVLYALHREKPDYGLRNVLPTADKVYKALRKLPGYALKANEMILKFERVYSRMGDSYLKDRARQEKDDKEYDEITPDDKLRGFKEYMRMHQQDFIDRINAPDASPMSQQGFNEHLEVFRMDFLERVANMTKRDLFHIDDDDVENAEIARVVELGRQQRYAAEVKKGWIEALGLDAAALDEDDDDQDVDDTRTEPELSEDDSALLAEVDCAPWSENSTLAHLLREGKPKPQSWQLEGAIDWRQHMKTLGLKGPLPGQVECHMAKQAVPVPDVECIESDVQQSHTPGTEQPEGLEISPRQANNNQQQIREGPQASISNVVVQENTRSQRANNIRSCLPMFEFQPPTQSQLERMEANSNMAFHISKSFATVEDDLASGRHQRSSTVPDTIYVAGDDGEWDSPRPASSFLGKAIGAPRHGVQVPRIFTGSFSQLETDIHRMRLDKVQTPEDQPDLSQIHDLKVRDFAVTPQISPSPTPSPATLLSRREALLSKETELQNRVINGEMVRTRRPSTKIRAQTVDETTGGLEAWLAKEGGRGDSPTLAAVPPTPRPERKNTI